MVVGFEHSAVCSSNGTVVGLAVIPVPTLAIVAPDQYFVNMHPQLLAVLGTPEPPGQALTLNPISADCSP